MTTPAPISPLVVPNVDAWRDWLVRFDEVSDGTWLTLAKKGTTSPTALSYQEALEEALCSGWIDGQRRALDAHVFVQRFTPRRPRSMWSQRNVDIVARLADAGRLRPRGVTEIERAQADGRWELAYPGSAAAEVPDDLRRALAAYPGAEALFAALSRADRFSALHPILTASDEGIRARRIATLVARL